MTARRTLHLWLALTLTFSLPALSQTHYSADLSALELGENAQHDSAQLVSSRQTNSEVLILGASHGFIGEDDRIYIEHHGADPLAAIKGHILTAATYNQTSRLVPFTFDPSTAEHLVIERAEFDTLLGAHYFGKSTGPYPAAHLHRELAGDADNADDRPNRRREDSLAQALGFFTGSRAVSENLALDRMLEVTAQGQRTIPFADIEGITTPAVDWNSLIAGIDLAAVAADAAPTLVPHDQHVVVAPSVSAVFDLIDVAETRFLPTISADGIASESDQLIQRYLRQIGLDIPRALAKTLPVDSVCITGGDPFFRLGTDIAIILNVGNPDAVLAAVRTIQSTRFDDDATTKTLRIADLPAVHSSSGNGDIHAFTALVKDAVVITNSRQQLERIIRVSTGDIDSLHDLDEYLYFRDQLPRTDHELAYIFLSDDTIRRWCSPAVRIGSARRLTALAALKRLTAQDFLEKDRSDDMLAFLGDVTSRPDSTPFSKIYGHSHMMTPLAALDFQTATEAESEAYNQWKDRYESGWRVFDPIALRLQRDPQSGIIHSDLSILPLTAGSDYREIMETVGASALMESTTLSHDGQMARLSITVDKDSEAFQFLTSVVFDRLDELNFPPLAWMEGDISVSIDDSALLRGLPHWKADNDMTIRMIFELGILIRIPSTNTEQLQKFTAAVIKKILEDDADWSSQTLNHQKISYTTLTIADELDDYTGYIAATETALLIAFSEQAMRDAIDREPSLAELTEPTISTATTLRDTQLFAQVKSRLLADTVTAVSRADSRAAQRTANRNLRLISTLNLLRRLSPDSDALDTFRRLTASHQIGAKGETFTWDEQLGSYTSSLHGPFLDPESAPDLDPPLAGLATQFDQASAALRFENDGLQLRLEITPPTPAPPAAEIPKFDPAGIEWCGLREGVKYKTRLGERIAAETHIVIVDNIVGEIGDHEVEIAYKSFLEDGTVTVGHSRVNISNGVYMSSTRLGDYAEEAHQPYYFLPPSLEVGATFQGTAVGYSGDVADLGQGSNTYSEYSTTVAGFEDITTEAGKFKDCLKISAKWQGFRPWHIENRSSTAWFARGIGIVKLEFSDGSWSELISYELPN